LTTLFTHVKRLSEKNLQLKIWGEEEYTFELEVHLKARKKENIPGNKITKFLGDWQEVGFILESV